MATNKNGECCPDSVLAKLSPIRRHSVSVPSNKSLTLTLQHAENDMEGDQQILEDIMEESEVEDITKIITSFQWNVTE